MTVLPSHFFSYHHLRSLHTIFSFLKSVLIFEMLDLGPRHHRLARRQAPPGATTPPTLPTSPSTDSSSTDIQPSATSSSSSAQTAATTSTDGGGLLGGLFPPSTTSSSLSSSSSSAKSTGSISTASHAQSSAGVPDVRVKCVRFFFPLTPDLGHTSRATSG